MNTSTGKPSLPPRPGEAIAFTAVLLAVTLALLASTFSLRASSALVPRAVGIPLAGLLIYRLVRETKADDAGTKGPLASPSARAPDQVGAMLWFLALPAASTVLGFVVGPALYVFAWARFRAGERVVFAAAAAATTAGAILVLFAWLLGMPLWSGVLRALI